MSLDSGEACLYSTGTSPDSSDILKTTANGLLTISLHSLSTLGYISSGPGDLI